MRTHKLQLCPAVQLPAGNWWHMCLDTQKGLPALQCMQLCHYPCWYKSWLANHM